MDWDEKDVGPLVEAIRPILAGKPPPIQSAVLADLLAMWLAGHGLGNGAESEQLREELLEGHVELVRQLIPVNVVILLSRRS